MSSAVNAFPGRRIAVALLCWLLGGVAIAGATDPFPQLAAAYLVQIGEHDLWAGQADKRLPPASLTKVMTALIVLEDYRPEQVVTVGMSAAQATGSRLRLRTGDRFSVEALLTATLIVSANDACAALAESNAGSIEAFVAKMNERARMLGLANTHFSNPCGFDAPEHYSSANDLARLSHAAMAHAKFAALSRGKPSAEIFTTDGKRRVRLKNKQRPHRRLRARNRHQDRFHQRRRKMPDRAGEEGRRARAASSC